MLTGVQRAVLVATVLCLCCAWAADVEAVLSSTLDRDGMWASFQSWATRYGRRYSSPSEERVKFSHYVVNMKAAEASRRRNPFAAFGETPFSDMSAEEFRRTHTNAQVPVGAWKLPPTRRPLRTTANVTFWNWTAHGAVTPIKQQGSCGSCWSFSATGVTEGQWFLAGNELTSLSEQELVSCVHDLVNFGCDGGAPEAAISWLEGYAAGAWATEAAYPYVSGQGSVPSCRENLVGNVSVAGAWVTGWEFVHPFDEAAMGQWLSAHGPIGVCLNADGWNSYQGGVMTNCTGGVLSLDHCVLLVGFDDGAQPPYWIVKNSWGTQWGENGYLRIEKGTDQCQLAEVPYAPFVGKAPAA